MLDPEQDKYIEKVLNDNKQRKRVKSIGDDDDDNSIPEDTVSAKTTTVEVLDEGDLKLAASYIEEQQAHLIISLLNDDDAHPSSKLAQQQQLELDEAEEDENDCKDMRPTLITMGIGKFLLFNFFHRIILFIFSLFRTSQTCWKSYG